MAPAIDFGCHHVFSLAVLPGALLATLLVFLLSGLGSVAGGRNRWVAADLLSGWGIVTILFTVGGIYLPGFLPVISAALGLAALIAIAAHIYRSKSAPWPALLIIAVLLQLWALVAINHAGISGWDDIAQWTPNALFLWRHDGFPAAGLPVYSNRPMYPYALAYLEYLVSLGHGAFVVQAGTMINWLLLTVFAWGLTAFDKTERPLPMQLMRFTIALALTTILNPGFNASFTVTNQSDTGTSVAAGFLALLLLHLHDAMRTKDKGRMQALAVQIALTASVLADLRDVNIVILMLLAGSSLLVALRDKTFGTAIRIWIPSVIPALAIFILWHSYSAHALPPAGKPPILPFAAWRWDLAPQLLAAAGKEMLKKNGFYALMLAATGFGAFAFLRGRTDRLGTLAVLTGVTFAGYCGFILIAFLGSSFFTEHNIVNAMSFFRYGTHVGLLGIAALWFLYERHVEPRIKPRVVVPVAAMAFALLPVVYGINAKWLIPQPSRAICAVRAFGDELAQRLPPESRIAILDNEGNGFEPYIVNLELALDDLHTGHQSIIVASTNAFEPERLPETLAQIRKGDINSVLLKQPTPELKQFFGISGDRPSTLLLHDGGGWKDIGAGLPPDAPAAP